MYRPCIHLRNEGRYVVKKECCGGEMKRNVRDDECSFAGGVVLEIIGFLGAVC